MQTYLSTPSGRIAVDIVGKGRPMLMWPSLFADASIMKHQRSFFSQSHQVLSVDVLGCHNDAISPSRSTIEQCTGAAVEVLKWLALRPAIFVGLGWGGLVGAQLAVWHPELISHLVMADAPLAAFKRNARRSNEAGTSPFMLRSDREPIISSEEDTFFIMDFPAVRTAIIPAAGHVSALDNPKRFNAAVERFLALEQTAIGSLPPKLALVGELQS